MASALTKFGAFCRDKRAVSNKTMGDQAEEMGIDVATISGIETGRKHPEPEYVDRFSSWLSLGVADRRELAKRTEAVVLSFPTKYIAKNSSSVRLFRRISKMDPSQIRAIRKQGRGENPNDG